MYQYQERGAEQWKNNQERYKSGDFDTFIKDEYKSKLFKPSNGHNDIRILPPSMSWASYGHYGLTLYRHMSIGPRRGAFLCHNHAIKGNAPEELVPGRQHNKCPVCAANEIARKQGNKKLSGQLYAKPGCIVWLIDRAAPEKGPQLWIMPATKVDKEILLRAYDAKRGKALPVDHPTAGYDVSFEVTQQQTQDGTFPNYSGINLDRETSPIVDDQGKLERYFQFLEANPLPGVLKYHDIAYISKELDGLDLDSPAGGEPDGTPASGPAGEREYDWSAPAPAKAAASEASAPVAQPAAPVSPAAHAGAAANAALDTLKRW